VPSPRVWIILVNWNGRAVTLDCLASLRRLEHPSFRVLVVDNASDDGSVDAVRSAHPEVEVLQMHSNLRFAGGNNAGMRHALAAGAGRIVLLNNDTTVAPDFLLRMEERLEADPRTGMVAPKIYYHAEPDRIWFAGGAISFWTGTMSHPGIRERDHGQFDATRPIDYATGCCVLTTREVIERAGMLDESFFIYGEDADWSMRVRNCGYGIVYEPRAKVWHKVSVSSGGHLSGFKMRHKFVSNFRFFVRHASWYHWLVFPWMNVLVNGIAAARYLLQRPS
jgi:GT2 family glycosyltransferase